MTNPSVLLRAKSDDRGVRDAAMDQLARVYYRPVYKHLRLKWRKSPEEAEELTQHFFVHALEREIFSAYELEKARFRTFVRVCVDRITMNHAAALKADKRGGQIRFANVDAREAEAEVAALGPVSEQDAERIFDQEWAKGVLSLSVDRLRAELEAAGKTRQLETFTRYDLGDDDLSYAALAEVMAVPVTTVTNDLSRARKALRRIVLDTLRELTASEEEFELEARSLGVR